MQTAELPDNGLHEEVSALFRELCHDVQLRCDTIYDRYLEGKEETTVKVIPPIISIREKLAGFLFLDPKVYSAVRDIDDNLGTLPTKGIITGINICMLNRLVERLSQMEYLQEDGEADRAGEIETIPEQAGVGPISWDF
jgi:hypothetical protein